LVDCRGNRRKMLNVVCGLKNIIIFINYNIANF
jgi:hypothetical protein